MATPGSDGSIGHLRCADSDRELVADVLGRAFSEGRLTLEEHDERLTRAYDARTFGDLDALTADLVAPLTATAAHSVPARRDRIAPPPAVGPVLRNSTTVLTTLKPGSPLYVPEVTSLTVILGDAKIDLVDATFAAPVVRLHLSVLMGDVKIRVPESIQVVSALNSIMSDFTTRDLSLAPSSVTVELHGTVVMGSVKVLGPMGRQAKYQRFVR